MSDIITNIIDKYALLQDKAKDGPAALRWRPPWEWLFALSHIRGSTTRPLTLLYVCTFLIFTSVSGPYRFLFNAKKLKGFMKPLKTIYLHTYKYDHQLKDIIALFEKPPLTTTNKTTPDIYQSSGEVSDGEDD